MASPGPIQKRATETLLRSVVHAGWLFKRGGRRAAWRKRYFVLRGDVIFYYHDSADLKHLGEIPLAGNVATTLLPSSQENLKAPFKYLFEIMPGAGGTGFAHNRDNYLLCASNALEMQEWMSKITHIINKQERALFKQTLSDSTDREKSMKNGGVLPIVVINTVCFLRKYGLKELGLFRQSGRAYRIKELQDAYDKGLYPILGTPDDTDVHSVAGLLKLYLRTVPDAVIPSEYSESFIAASKFYQQNSSEEGVQVMIGQLKALPDANYNTLKYLCRFLHEVQEFSEENRMDLNNLATVFGPNFVRTGPGEENMKDIEAMRRVMEGTSNMNSLTRILIAEHATLFPKTPDEHPVFSGEDAGPVTARSGGRDLMDFQGDDSDDATLQDDDGSLLGTVSHRSPGTLDMTKKRRSAPSLAHHSLTTNNLIDARPPMKSPHTSYRESTVESLISFANSSSEEERGILPSSSDDSEVENEREPKLTASAGGDQKGLTALRERVEQLQRKLEEQQQSVTRMKRQLATEVQSKRAYERRYVDERSAREAAEERCGRLEKQLDELFAQHFPVQK